MRGLVIVLALASAFMLGTATTFGTPDVPACHEVEPGGCASGSPQTQAYGTCAEDEVIVWVDTGHDACVALDDFWWDAETETVHWYTTAERTANR